MWHEFYIELPGALKEPVTAVLYGLGCQGMQEEADALRAYFPVSVSAKEVEEALSVFEGVSVVQRLIEEHDWYAPWKERFQPLHAAGLLICPPWLECEPGPGEKPLILDPAQAFGAGDHVTTLTVLKMMRAWTGSRNDLAGKRFLDIGTGTGILAIAAHLYGFGGVTAVDVERSAVEAAERNFALNGMTGRARIIKGSISEAGTGFDLITANLFQESLLEVIPDVPAALNPGGGIIISGLLAGQEPPVFKSAEDAGLMVAEKLNYSGWVSARLSYRPKAE